MPENGFDPFPTSASDAVTSAPETEIASSVRSDQIRYGDSDVQLSGVEPTTISHFHHYTWAQDNDSVLAELGQGGAIVQKTLADKHDLDIGSRFSVLTAAGTEIQLTVRGITDPPRLDPLLGEIQINQTTFDANFNQSRNSFTFIDTTSSPNQATATSLRARLASFPDTKLQTKQEFVTDRFQNVDTILNLLYVLLALSVIVSLFGMVNTLVLSVFERTRELGMLRAIGMTRRQTRRMIRHESVITALIGAALGMPLGIFLATLVTKGLSTYGISIAIPIGTLTIFALTAIAAGTLAAVLPARRAARLQPLEALHYE